MLFLIISLIQGYVVNKQLVVLQIIIKQVLNLRIILVHQHSQ